MESMSEGILMGVENRGDIGNEECIEEGCSVKGGECGLGLGEEVIG